jgi:hypothetical protein
MSEVIQSRLSKAAVFSFVLGIASLFLSVTTALPALFLGVAVLREINRSDGRLRGQRLAIAGLCLSGFVTMLTIVGVFVLLLFVVQEKNQLVGCSNNLRLLGQATARYRDHHEGYYPSGTVRNDALPPEKRLSWEAALVPYLSESAATKKRWDKLEQEIAFDRAWDDPTNAGLRQNVTPFLCPTFAHDLPAGQVGLSSTIGIAGVGLESPQLPRKDPRAGFFGYDRRIKQTDITAGTSATMMATETTQDNGPWAAGGPATVRGLDPDARIYIGRGRPLGGLHREELNVLWADGSARVIRETINPDVFREQARINRPEIE